MAFAVVGVVEFDRVEIVRKDAAMGGIRFAQSGERGADLGHGNGRDVRKIGRVQNRQVDLTGSDKESVAAVAGVMDANARKDARQGFGKRRAEEIVTRIHVAKCVDDQCAARLEDAAHGSEGFAGHQM